MSNFTKFKKFSELNYARTLLKSIKITKVYTYFEYFFKKTEFLYQKFKVDFKGRFRTKMPISPVVSYSVELWRFPLIVPQNIYKQYDDIKNFFSNFEDRTKSKKIKGFRFYSIVSTLGTEFLKVQGQFTFVFLKKKKFFPRSRKKYLKKKNEFVFFSKTIVNPLKKKSFFFLGSFSISGCY